MRVRVPPGMLILLSPEAGVNGGKDGGGCCHVRPVLRRGPSGLLRTVVLAPVSTLALFSLKSSSWREPVTAASPERGRVLRLRRFFPPKPIKNTGMVQSFVLRHRPGFVLLFQLAFA